VFVHLVALFFFLIRAWTLTTVAACVAIRFTLDAAPGSTIA